MIKAAIILGISGLCRENEIVGLMWENVVDEGAKISFSFYRSKRNGPKILTKCFVDDITMLTVLRTYISKFLLEV